MTRGQLRFFRALGIAEGLSLLALLFIAIPVRRISGDPSLVQGLGAVHGVVFLMYVYTLVDSTAIGGWGVVNLLKGLVASCVPFGSFWFDHRVLRHVPTVT